MMKALQLKSLKFLLSAGFLACSLLPAFASAAPVRFNIAGQFDRPTLGTFTGTIDIDPDLGTIAGVSILFPGLATFDIIRTSVAQQPKSWRIRVDNADRDALSFFFTTPEASGRVGSLLDFHGGSISSGTLAGPDITGTITGFSGSISRAAVSVPEPAVPGMFGAGVLLLGLAAGLRRRYA
jgi:hypothetical protein